MFGDGLQFSVGLSFAAAERDLRGFFSRAKTLSEGITSIGATAAKAGLLMGAGLAAGGVGLKSILDAGAQMETFSMRLTTMMGSAASAKARMGELYDFAATTPFELDQVIGAEVTLRGFGAAAEEVMPGLIDFAATTGAELSQSAIDIGKAWNQGATGLESDTAKILRKQIELRTGLDATKMSIEDFRAALLDTLDEGMFAGGAARLSQTFSGMMSNLNDSWAQFKTQVADAGLFNNVKGALSVTLDLIGKNKLEAQGWARVLSDGIWSTIKMIAFGLAGALDAVTALGSAFLTIKAYAADFGATVAETHLAILETVKAAAQLAGVYDEARGDALIGEARSAAEAFRTTATETYALVDSLGESGTALTRTEAFFSAAEAAARGFSAAAEEAGRAPQGAAPAAGGGAGKATDDGLAKQMEAAIAFSQELTALGQTETQQAQAEYAKRMGMLLEFNRQRLITGELFAQSALAIEQEYSAQIDAIREAEAERERERRQSLANDTISGTQGLFSALQGLMDQHNAEQKAAYKALGIAQVAVSTAVGISRAFADYGWPGGIAPAALTAATGIAQGAAIAAAHQGTSGEPVVYMHQGGGPSRPAPDEMDVRKLRQEAVLNSQATRELGPQGIDALNSGRMPAQEISLTIGRTQQREVIRGELRTGGTSLLKRALAGSHDPAPGFSGRGAPA